MELNNPYVFLGKIKNMKSFDEMLLFIMEERNKHIRKIKRIRFGLSSLSIFMITYSFVEFGNHRIGYSILLFSSSFLTLPIIGMLNKNNHVNRYDLVLNEIKKEELKRSRFKK